MPCSNPDEDDEARIWDVEDSLIIEVPQTSQSGEGLRWRLPLAVLVCATAVLAVLLLWHSRPIEQLDVAASISEELLQRIRMNQSHLEDDEKEFVTNTVQHAQGLHLEQPLRSLKDVFYSEISETSEDYPFIRTECVIDTVQATTYLMEAIVNLYRAIDQRGQRCGTVGLGGSDVGCAINVIGFITCLSWVAAYLSLAASACAQAVNPGALCVADWMTITGAFGEIAYAGAGVRFDCNVPGKWALRKGFGITTTLRPYLKYFPDARKLEGPGPRPTPGPDPILGPAATATAPPAAAPPAAPRRAGDEEAKLPPPILETIYKVKNLKQARRYRKFDIALCVADAFQEASFLIRALLQIRDSAQACPDPRNCAINIMNVISSFAWISHFSLQAVDDCTKRGSQEARCGQEISALLGALLMSPAAGYATSSDCAANPDPKYELLHEPTP